MAKVLMVIAAVARSVVASVGFLGNASTRKKAVL